MIWCSFFFNLQSTHEPGCALRHGGKFDVDSDEDDNTSIYDNDTTYNSGDEMFGQNTGDWRKTHEDLIHNIRKAKRAAAKSGNGRYSSARSSSTSRDNKDEGIGRVFSVISLWHKIGFIFS